VKASFFAVGLGMTILASGCSQGSALSQLPPLSDDIAATRDMAGNSGYRILFSFYAFPKPGNEPGAFFPIAGLTQVNDELYGTTSESLGTGVPGSAYSGGTIFSITPAGVERVAYAFKGADGDCGFPAAGLLENDHTLYGTTEYGGYYALGGVFKLLPSGAERVLHSFIGGADGANPLAGVIEVNGALYGTTEFGGAYSRGTVFRVTTYGKEDVLYSFGKSTEDGRYPAASLIEVDGKLYGTTQSGGTSNDGTIFSIALPGAERVLYSFRNGADGARPVASLVRMGNALYGTTQDGGAYGSGTVFSLTLAGVEKVLHSFGGTGDDGRAPVAALIAIGNTLYGTTSLGGTYMHDIGGGGTVFSVSATGAEKVLHSFGTAKDGFSPLAPLLALDDTLYGTTQRGGTDGGGTVFALKLQSNR
jgi:uncharacterized repeat protein (TIGR03803 family)